MVGTVLFSLFLGALTAFGLYAVSESPPLPSDPSYLPKPSRSCHAPPLRTRPFSRHNCLIVSQVTDTSATILINLPTNDSHTLHCANYTALIHSSSSHTVSPLLPDSRYTLNLRSSYTVCSAQISTRASLTNFVNNPSFESTAESPFLASRFRLNQKHSPASWTPFYNGGARRRCGILPLSNQTFTYPKAGNCVLALGSFHTDVLFDQAQRFYGGHQAIRLDLSAALVSAWYMTDSTTEYVPYPESKHDSLSMVISWVLDDGSLSDGVLIPLIQSQKWTPVCAYIAAPEGREIHTLHIFFHMHDFRRGALLIDDVAVVKPGPSVSSWRTCYRTEPSRSASFTSSGPTRTHLASAVRPQQKQLTLAVPLTADRVLRLEAMSRLYAGGPIVAAVIVRDEREANLFQTIWRRKGWLRSHVDVLFVKRGSAPIPINAVRNIAVSMARTDYVVMLDVDMTPATDAFSCFRDAGGKYLDALLPRGVKRIATLPVFITDVHHRSARNKDELVNMLGRKVGTSYCVNSQKSNKIKRWYMSSEASETRFTTDYEPYGIVRRELHPIYDERFSGYGFNKIAWALEAESIGFQMFVLPEQFVTHLNHIENQWVSSINVGHYLQTWRRYLGFVAEIANGMRSWAPRRVDDESVTKRGIFQQ